jgi:DnaK suppressor protein
MIQKFDTCLARATKEKAVALCSCLFLFLYLPLSSMTQEEIKNTIIAEINKTKNTIADYLEMTKPIAPDEAIGRVSRMDAINNKSVTDSALRQAEEKLQKLEFALTKIGSSDFGICQKCKSEIPLGRILIKPESLYCVRCAQ